MNRKARGSVPATMGAGGLGSGFFLISHLSPAQSLRYMVAAFLVAFAIVFIGLRSIGVGSTAGGSGGSMRGGGGGLYGAAPSSSAPADILRTLTWNVAAINNNPFEYWITTDDAGYNNLMRDVSDLIRNPGAFDVPVEQVFTQEMYDKLRLEMAAAQWSGLEKVDALWRDDFRRRRIVTEFIRDEKLGKKRLASMPDRVSNTIDTSAGSTEFRPTVINCYSGDLSSTKRWLGQWIDFMFHKKISLRVSEGKGAKTTLVRDMLSKISHSKYPAISVEEEEISIPLQTMCLAIFDSILVHMLNHAAPAWQPLRSNLCNKLNLHKADRTIEILEESYIGENVVFLQEVDTSLVKKIETSRSLGRTFEVITPSSMDADRGQNSIILLRKDMFMDTKEITEAVVSQSRQMRTGNDSPAGSKKHSGPALEPGDLIVLSATRRSDRSKFILASFHGDTNGLATKDVLAAVHHYAVSAAPDHKLLFGMDANSYAAPSSDQLGVEDFGSFYTGLKLNSCYGKTPSPRNFTTFHARTYLQTQLNKAITAEEKDSKGDKNPKDFIVFFDGDFDVVSTTKDNTGRRNYVENMVFPTLDFPSDHGITSTVLREKRSANK